MQPCDDPENEAPRAWVKVPGESWSVLPAADAATPVRPLAPSAHPRSRSRLPGRGQVGLLLVVYVALAGFWNWRLTQATETAAGPNLQERSSRLARAAKYVSKAPPETVQPILMSLASIDDTRLAALDRWLDHPPMQQLRELTVVDTDFLRGGGTLRDALLLAWLGHEPGGALVEAQLMVTAAGARVDDTLKLHALEQLAARAMAQDQPEAAASILERACGLPGATWHTVTALAAASRAAGQTGPALNAITRWVNRRDAAESGDEIERARDLELTLMLQTGRAEVALDVQLDRLKRAPSGLLPERTLDRALVCALATQQKSRVLPFIDTHVAAFPEARLEWQALMGGAEVSPGYRRWLREQAAICDSDLPAPRAFEALLRLAATGEGTALPRLCAVAKPAERESLCATFLTAALEMPLLRPSVLELAQTDALARRVVAEALRKAPKDRALHYAAALAEGAAAKKPAAAAMVWQTFLQRFPNEAAALRRLIQVHLAARQPALALSVYEGIKSGDLTEDDRLQKEILEQL